MLSNIELNCSYQDHLERTVTGSHEFELAFGKLPLFRGTLYQEAAVSTVLVHWSLLKWYTGCYGMVFWFLWIWFMIDIGIACLVCAAFL